MKTPKRFTSRVFPFGSYSAINLFGYIVVKKGIEFRGTDINHELIHSRQQAEMLWLFFYLWYVVEWLIRFICLRNSTKAYYNISFEREAYHNQHNLRYLRHRRPYAWLRYLR